MYKHYENSVGDNLKHIQITTKYRYAIMQNEKERVCCKVAIEEACNRYKIKIAILKVMPEHVHLMVDCPRILSDAKMVQLIKGFSAYLMFRLCPELRKTYYKGSFWNAGYFCCSVGVDFDRTFSYIENQ